MARETRFTAFAFAAFASTVAVGVGLPGLVACCLEAGAAEVPYYGACCEAKTGEVKPTGYLLEFLRRQAEGLTGHREKLGYPFVVPLPSKVALKSDRNWHWLERGPITFAYAVPSEVVEEDPGDAFGAHGSRCSWSNCRPWMEGGFHAQARE